MPSQGTTARRVLPLFDPVNLAAIVFGHPQKVQRLISWGTSCGACGHAPGAFGMYVWFGRGFQYVGIARFARVSRQRVSGLVCRLFEHLTLRARPGCANGNAFRYGLARKFQLASLMWLPVRSGHGCEVRARESLTIKMYRPNANVGGKCNRSAIKPKKRRRRPLPWMRAAMKQQDLRKTWSSGLMGQCLDRHIVRGFDTWPCHSHDSFLVAYRKLQLRLFLSGGHIGPLNVYSAQFRY